jgi:hypothetical protein
MFENKVLSSVFGPKKEEVTDRVIWGGGGGIV